MRPPDLDADSNLYSRKRNAFSFKWNEWILDLMQRISPAKAGFSLVPGENCHLWDFSHVQLGRNEVQISKNSFHIEEIKVKLAKVISLSLSLSLKKKKTSRINHQREEDGNNQKSKQRQEVNMCELKYSGGWKDRVSCSLTRGAGREWSSRHCRETRSRHMNTHANISIPINPFKQSKSVQI